jgi:hypothetical protein
MFNGDPMNRPPDRPTALNDDLNSAGAPAPPFALLTPPEAAATLGRLAKAAAERGDRGLAEALEHARRLALARPYLRHDPDCAHCAPRGVGATRCTCGLERALQAHK